jgi:hypothetical protein
MNNDELEKKYLMATEILEDVWLHIDWDNIGAGRRMGIYSELEGQVKGLSRCYSSMEKFLNKLCIRFGSYLHKYQTENILKDKALQAEIMEVFRNETQIPILLLRLRRDEAKLKREQSNQLNLG